MSEQELKLLKTDEKQSMDIELTEPVAANNDEQAGQDLGDAPMVQMTPAEAEEAARFRRLAADKAARQVMLQQIMAELADLDDLSAAA